MGCGDEVVLFFSLPFSFIHFCRHRQRNEPGGGVLTHADQRKSGVCFGVWFGFKVVSSWLGKGSPAGRIGEMGRFVGGVGFWLEGFTG